MRARRLTVAVAAGAIAVGAAGVVAYPAFADDTPSAPPSASATPGSPGTPEAGDDARQDRIKEQLKSLVDDGTITQEQADKVAEKLAGSGAGWGGGPHLNLRGGGPFGVALDEVAKALGMSKDDVQSGLADGKSVKELAEAQGKDVNDVIDALVSAAGPRIDQAVKDGKLTQDAADQLKAKLKERITSVVENGLPKLPKAGQWGGKNGDGPRMGHRGGQQGGQGNGQGGEQGNDATPAPGPPSPQQTGPGASDSSFLGVA